MNADTRFPLALPPTSEQAAHSNRQLLDSLNHTGPRSTRSQSGVGEPSATPPAYELDPASFFFPLLPYGFSDSVAVDGWVCQIGTKGSGSIARVFDQQTQGDVIELLASPNNPLINYTSGPAGVTTNAHKSVTGVAPGFASAFAMAGQGLEESAAHRARGESLATAQPAAGAASSAAALSTTLVQKAAAAAKRRQIAALQDTAMEFPSPSQFIGTSLPILNIQMKNLNKYVSLEVEVEDTLGQLYRFHISNSCTVVRIRLDSAQLPLSLTGDWNKLALDLGDLTRACFNSTYKQTHRVRILASCRIRRVFFSDIRYPDFALPSFLRIFSEAFYEAKRTEDQQQQQSPGTAATEDEEQDRANMTGPAHPTRPSRLREQLQGELAAARALESQMGGTSSTNPHDLAATAAGGGGGAQHGQLFEQRLLDTQESRILARHAETQSSWSAFKSRTAARLGVRESQLNISRTDNFRAKQEELAIVDHSVPESDKQGAGREEMWAGSLRGTGDSWVGVGNMFSGLWTRVKANPNPKVEIIRKPQA